MLQILCSISRICLYIYPSVGLSIFTDTTQFTLCNKRQKRMVRGMEKKKKQTDK